MTWSVRQLASRMRSYACRPRDEIVQVRVCIIGYKTHTLEGLYYLVVICAQLICTTRM